MKLEDDVLVYPAHGAGSLCGKAIGSENVSTIAKEKATNYALQEMTEIAFIDLLLEDQPFIPKYFTYNVEVNKRGAGKLTESIQKTVILKDNFLTQQSALPIIDGRNESAFKSSHLPGAINIISGPKFESWLGALLSPGQSFYLVADNNENLQSLIKRAAKIGYEKYIVGAFIYDLESGLQTELFNKIAFDQNPSAFTVLDIRTETENAKKPVFKNALNIPLHELENRAHEIPTDKPIIVHCATGYRSAVGSSLISKKLPQAKVIDMGGAIKTYQ
jgi:rhodanese-related sulfurtransferase